MWWQQMGRKSGQVMSSPEGDGVGRARNNLNGRNALILGYHPSKEGLYTLITGQTNFVLLRAQNLRSLEADGGSTELAKVKALMQVGNGGQSGGTGACTAQSD